MVVVLFRYHSEGYDVAIKNLSTAVWKHLACAIKMKTAGAKWLRLGSDGSKKRVWLTFDESALNATGNTGA
jgi:hypothetical protein